MTYFADFTNSNITKYAHTNCAYDTSHLTEISQQLFNAILAGGMLVLEDGVPREATETEVQAFKDAENSDYRQTLTSAEQEWFDFALKDPAKAQAIAEQYELQLRNDAAQGKLNLLKGA